MIATARAVSAGKPDACARVRLLFFGRLRNGERPSRPVLPATELYRIVNQLAFSSHIDVSPQEVFQWHTRPEALRRLIPPWSRVDVLSHEGVQVGERTRLRINVGPFSMKWTAEHTERVENSHFADRQRRGPFRLWEHVHRVSPEESGCQLADEIRYAMPFGMLADALVGRIVRRRLTRQFAYRHRTARNDIRLHSRYGSGRLRIAVGGSEGLIGSTLITFLRAGGHEAYRLVQENPEDPQRDIHWNHRDGIVEMDKLEGLDAVVHLAGESVLAPRWSQQKKMEIIGSRVGGTEHLAHSLARLRTPPKAFISASAVGYYGDRGDELLDEDSPPGDDGFLSALCQEWEHASSRAADAGIRTVQARIGTVLSPRGGVLSSLLIPFRLGLGGRYGGPNQYMSWIGLDDAVGGLYHAATDDTLEGPINLTSPAPVTLTEFADVLGRVLSRPIFVKLPPRLVRILLGEVADDAALMSVRAKPSRLRSAGYDFLFPDIERMLRHVLGRTLQPFDGEDVDASQEIPSSKIETAG